MTHVNFSDHGGGIILDVGLDIFAVVHAFKVSLASDDLGRMLHILILIIYNYFL